MQSYLDQLNDVQRKAVTQIEGPSLVIAGAGSGKTRVLTFRIAHLLNTGVSAGSILSLTFTNKAAREMQERIAKIVGAKTSRNLWMGTFHSLFARILRNEHEYLGFPSNFSIYDSIDSKSMIKSIIKEMRLDDRIYKPVEIQKRISQAKNNLVTAEAYAHNDKAIEIDQANKRPRTAEIYQQYMKRCHQSGAMDFDDLLLYTNMLFRDNPRVLAKYRNIFKYILVDEYQDTNFAQYLIVKKLASKNRNVCVVGDDAQSIYSFRGAKIENILNFRNDYPDYKLFKLEQNYRSTQTIVNAANSLIDKNKEQIQKVSFSENDPGNLIRLFQAYSDVEEGMIVCNDIATKCHQYHYAYKDFAILYRTNMQSRIFEEAMRKKGIPYKIFGGLSFFQRKEVKDLISYFRIVSNPKDSESLKRIINYPTRGIGQTTVTKLEEAASAHEINIWNILTHLPEYNLGLNSGTLSKLTTFVSMIQELGEGLDTGTAYESASNIAKKSGLLHDLATDKSPEGIGRHENIVELLNGLQDFTQTRKEEGEFATLASYLEEVALITDQDTEEEGEFNKVTLMTVHSSKGLEFKNVYIVGMEEQLFPSLMSTGSAQGLEEERRLFYVAITRAEQNCSISFAKNRYKYGKPANCSPSRFLKDIDEQYLELPDHYNPAWNQEARQAQNNFKSKRVDTSGFTLNNLRKTIPKTENQGSGVANRLRPTSRVPLTSFKGDDASKIQVGMNVEHMRFGQGKVVHLEGKVPNIKATVFFQNAGQKQLLLKFAKLRILT